MEATDRDDPRHPLNARITYSLESPSGDLDDPVLKRFKIQRSSGRISTAQSLDREEMQNYTVMAVATDLEGKRGK